MPRAFGAKHRVNGHPPTSTSPLAAMSGSVDVDPSLTEEELAQKEADHVAEVCRAFLAYKEHAMNRVMRAYRSYTLLSPRHRVRRSAAAAAA